MKKTILKVILYISAFMLIISFSYYIKKIIEIEQYAHVLNYDIDGKKGRI